MTWQAHGYILLTAARNEACQIGKVIEAVARQSVLPVRWVIVDDGSHDGTAEAIRVAGGRLSFLVCMSRQQANSEQNFRSKADALRLAWEHAAAVSFAYVGILDADMVPPRDYYERVIDLFERNPRLGVAGGWILEERDGTFRARKGNRLRSVAGGCQVFRRVCYEAIDGIPPLRYGGEDTLAEIYAEMHGWMVHASADLPLHHLRSAGTAQGGPLRSAILEGKREYHLGYHPLFTIAKAIRRIPERPFLLRSLCRLGGSVSCLLRSEARDVAGDAIWHLRARQMDVLGSACRPGSHDLNPMDATQKVDEGQCFKTNGARTL